MPATTSETPATDTVGMAAAMVPASTATAASVVSAAVAPRAASSAAPAGATARPSSATTARTAGSVAASARTAQARLHVKWFYARRTSPPIGRLRARSVGYPSLLRRRQAAGASAQDSLARGERLALAWRTSPLVSHAVSVAIRPADGLKAPYMGPRTVGRPTLRTGAGRSRAHAIPCPIPRPGPPADARLHAALGGHVRAGRRRASRQLLARGQPQPDRTSSAAARRQVLRPGHEDPRLHDADDERQARALLPRRHDDERRARAASTQRPVRLRRHRRRRHRRTRSTPARCRPRRTRSPPPSR